MGLMVIKKKEGREGTRPPSSWRRRLHSRKNAGCGGTPEPEVPPSIVHMEFTWTAVPKVPQSIDPPTPLLLTLESGKTTLETTRKAVGTTPTSFETIFETKLEAERVRDNTQVRPPSALEATQGQMDG